MHQENPDLLEMGSTSLKFYEFDQARMKLDQRRVIKVSWNVAHRHFGEGEIGTETFSEICSAIRRVEVLVDASLKGSVAIATGVFRELPNLEPLSEYVAKETGVQINVISASDEASLAGVGLQKRRVKQSCLLCDIGGATTEWAWHTAENKIETGSLLLGAIRNTYLFKTERQEEMRNRLQDNIEYCDALLLENLPDATAAEVICTGGTAKAMVLVHGSEVMQTGDVESMIYDMIANGIPNSLHPERQPIFLSGSLIAWRLAIHCGARYLRYGGRTLKE